MRFCSTLMITNLFIYPTNINTVLAYPLTTLYNPGDREMNNKWCLPSRNSLFIKEISHIHQKKSSSHSTISALMAMRTKCFKGIDEEMSSGVVL